MRVAEFVRRAQFFTYCLIRLCVPAARRPLCFAAYAYVRWLDDQIDKPCPTISDQGKGLLSKHRNLISKGMPLQANVMLPEAILESVGLLEILPDAVRSSLATLLDCIAYDLLRRGRIPVRKELDEWILRESKALDSLIQYFCAGVMLRSTGARLASAAKITHIVRDVVEDIDSGMVNITSEASAAMGIDVPTVIFTRDFPRLRPWISLMNSTADRQFRRAWKHIHLHPSLRYKFATALLSAKYCQYRHQHRWLGWMAWQKRNRFAEWCLFFLAAVPLIVSIVMNHVRSARYNSRKRSRVSSSK